MTNKREQQIQLSLLKDQANQIKKLSTSSSLELIKAAENKLFNDAIKVIEPFMQFAELGFDTDTGEVNSIPFEWEGLSEEEKQKKIRLAKAGWMNSSDVPHGVKMAHATVIGIIKAKATEQSGARTLNIQNASFPSPAPLAQAYEVIDIEE